MSEHRGRRLAVAAFGLSAVLALGGCGAGQITQTDTQQPAVDGAMAAAHGIALRDAALAFPPGQEHVYRAGDDAPLSLSIVNRGGTTDELLSVSSPAARSATVDGTRTVVAGATLIVGAERGELAAQAQVTREGVPGGDPMSWSPESLPGQDPGLTEAGQAQVVLRGLTREVRPGQTVKVTFTFRDAGAITTDVPIHALVQPREPAERVGGEDHGGGQGDPAGH